MATAKYELLYPEILRSAINCPEPIVLNAVRNACIEFCNSTHYLTQDIDPITIIAGEPTYTIDAPAGMDVIQVLNPLYCSGKRLPPFVRLGILSISDWQAHVGAVPTAYTCFSPADITVYPKPTVDIADALTGRMAVAPSRTSTSTDAGLLADFRTELAAGALAQILAVPDQPYTDKQMALWYKGQFDAAKSNAAITVRTAFMNTPMRVQFPGF